MDNQKELIVEGLILSIGTVDEMGNSFSKECLEGIEKKKDIPFVDNYSSRNIIGKVINLEVTKEGLKVKAVANEEKLKELGHDEEYFHSLIDFVNLDKAKLGYSIEVKEAEETDEGNLLILKADLLSCNLIPKGE